MLPMLTLALALYAGIVSLVPPVQGSYVVRTMNGKGLPTDIRMPTPAGAFRLFRLEQGVLTLKPGGRFTLYFRYYHQLVQRGARPTSTPVLSDSETGTYRVDGGKLLLSPAKKAKERSRPNIAATLVGEELRASYVLMNGTLPYRVTLVFRRDASFW
jgi:hypothetical protein